MTCVGIMPTYCAYALSADTTITIILSKLNAYQLLVFSNNLPHTSFCILCREEKNDQKKSFNIVKSHHLCLLFSFFPLSVPATLSSSMFSLHQDLFVSLCSLISFKIWLKNRALIFSDNYVPALRFRRKIIK